MFLSSLRDILINKCKVNEKVSLYKPARDSCYTLQYFRKQDVRSIAYFAYNDCNKDTILDRKFQYVIEKGLLYDDT